MNTVGEVLGHRPSGLPIQCKEGVLNPTIGELDKHCSAKIDAQKALEEEDKPTSPIFGPERPLEEK